MVGQRTLKNSIRATGVGLHTGRKDVGPHMIASGRSGWYLRVLEPATVDPRGELVLVERVHDRRRFIVGLDRARDHLVERSETQPVAWVLIEHPVDFPQV